LEVGKIKLHPSLFKRIVPFINQPNAVAMLPELKGFPNNS
jgi:hypothetical protein